MILAITAGESAPDTPNHAAAKGVGPDGGRLTGGVGKPRAVPRALLTALLTADLNASIVRYVRLDGPPRARPRIVPWLSQMTAEVLVPPQSTQRKKDIRRNQSM